MSRGNRVLRTSTNIMMGPAGPVDLWSVRGRGFVGLGTVAELNRVEYSNRVVARLREAGLPSAQTPLWIRGAVPRGRGCLLANAPSIEKSGRGRFANVRGEVCFVKV